MNSKVLVHVSEKSDSLFNDSLAGIHESNKSLPQVSAKDKKGGKLTKTMVPLLDKCIDSAPQLEKHLPREFTVQNLINNREASKKQQARASALERELKRVKDGDTCIGIEIAKDYRIMYEAAKKAAAEDASLIPLRDQLGAPFQKALSAESKQEKKDIADAKKAAKAAKKLRKKA